MQWQSVSPSAVLLSVPLIEIVILLTKAYDDYLLVLVRAHNFRMTTTISMQNADLLSPDYKGSKEVISDSISWVIGATSNESESGQKEKYTHIIYARRRK